MPSKSKSQQRLFGMALAVRRGELKRSEVGKEVLDIVDGDMTDKEIEDFAKERTSDKEHNVKEELSPDEQRIKDAPKNGSILHQTRPSKDPEDSAIGNYLKNLRYAGMMRPIIDVSPKKHYVFVVVKPGFCKLTQTVIERFQEAGFTLYKTRTKLLTEREARQMYYVHKDESFFKDLCKYMASDISIGILLEYPDTWTEKEAFAKTDDIKDSIRKEFQESDMRNVMHSSDNITNMRIESAKYFNELI